MSGGIYCTCDKKDKKNWRVGQRKCNHSAFNGYKYTSSNYSQVFCIKCGSVWRTKANYVLDLKDMNYEAGRF